MPLINTKPTFADRATKDEIVSEVDQIPEKCSKDYEDAPEIGVGVKVIAISDMDMASGTFSADINVNVAWKGEKDDEPVIQFYNLAEATEPDTAEAKKGKKGWDWFYRTRVRATFRQSYDLHEFPFDEQHLQIDVRFKKACKLVPLAWAPNGDACSCDSRAVSEDFNILSATVKHSYLPSYKFGELGGYDPEAAIVFTVARKPLFWVVSYGLMASLIASLMVCTYAIPPDSVSDRLGVAMTLVLTITATKYMMMDKLPSVAYFTLLDIHILICCIFLTVLTVEVSLAEFVGHERLASLEKRLLPLLALLWMLYHGFVAARIFVL